MTMNNAAKGIQVFVGMYVFISLGKLFKSEIAGSDDKIVTFYETVCFPKWLFYLTLSGAMQ